MGDLRTPATARGQGPGREPGRGRRGRGGNPADHRDGSAGGGARGLGPGDLAGPVVQRVRGGAAWAVRPLPQRGQVRPDQAGVRVLLPRHRLPPPRPARADHQQRGHPHVRPGADDPRPGGAGRVLAAAERLAAGPAVAGRRGALPGPDAVDRRQSRVRAARRDFPRRPRVRDHAVHPVRADSGHVQLPRGRPARHSRAARRGAAGGERGGLAAVSRQADRRRGGRDRGRAGDQRARSRLVRQSAGPGDAEVTAEGDDAHHDAAAGRPDRRRSLALDRGGLPVRAARRDSRLRPAVRARGPGTGDRRRPPDRGRVPLPAARAHDRGDEQAPVLRRPDQHLAPEAQPAVPGARRVLGREADARRLGHRLALAPAAVDPGATWSTPDSGSLTAWARSTCGGIQESFSLRTAR